MKEDDVLDDGFEVRAGAERMQPVRSRARTAAWKALTLSLYSEAPGAIAYVGPDPIEAASFPGSSRRLLGTRLRF